MTNTRATSACRDSMVVRVYRRTSDGAAVAGIVEDPERGTSRAFASSTELLELLAARDDGASRPGARTPAGKGDAGKGDGGIKKQPLPSFSDVRSSSVAGETGPRPGHEKVTK